MDCISVILSYNLTRSNQILSIIHFIIHFAAILHLFDVYKTLFMSNVFKMADHEFADIPKSHIIMYNIGTILDILCHCVNAYNFALKNIS